jgi:DNA-binding NarL/FixJ family response regulator
MRDRGVANIRARLGEELFAAAWAQGRAMSREEAIDEAVAGAQEILTSTSSHEPRAGLALSGLTPREQEVAALVAQGLNNRQIAEHLVISERTAENHISHVLDKLGLDSRTNVATWVIARSRQLNQR